MNSMALTDYTGCIHFHSNYSYDAAQPVAAIIEAGLRAGLDYAILTDHFKLDAQKDGWERYHETAARKLLLIVGEEISPRYNHYLALNLKEPIVVEKMRSDAQAMIDAVTRQGGFGFIAHPDHPGAPLAGTRAYPWIDWQARGYSGMSIWDLMGDWSSGLSSPWRILKAALWPAGVLKGPRPETLRRWDEFTRRGPCAAIGEVDNHGNRKQFWGFSRRIFSFDFAFRTIRTHVLLEQPLSGDATADRAALLEACRTGQSYVSLDLWNDPRGFSFEVLDAQRRVSMGQTFIRSGPTLVEVKLPSRGRIRLIRNGQIIWEERRRSHLERDVDLPGVYRIEVDQPVRGRWRPWIFSNPIWVQ